jgi:hypothetical protein
VSDRVSVSCPESRFDGEDEDGREVEVDEGLSLCWAEVDDGRSLCWAEVDDGRSLCWAEVDEGRSLPPLDVLVECIDEGASVSSPPGSSENLSPGAAESSWTALSV